MPRAFTLATAFAVDNLCRLASFRSERLKTPTRGDVARHNEAMKQYEKALKQKRKVERPQVRVTRSIATVNRELALLRRMFNVAQKEGWMTHNPFAMGEPLVSVADEKKRERILTREEETRLLEACSDSRRRPSAAYPHLCPRQSA